MEEKTEEEAGVVQQPGASSGESSKQELQEFDIVDEEDGEEDAGQDEDAKAKPQNHKENGEVISLSDEDSNSTKLKQETHDKDKEDVIELIICPEMYPMIVFTKKQVIATEKHLLRQITFQKNVDLKPQFQGFKLQDGVLKVKCVGEKTKGWLEGCLTGSKAYGAPLKLLKPEDLPTSWSYKAEIEATINDSNEDILGFFEAQNEGLSVKSWVVTSRSQYQGKVSMVLKIDRKSEEVLKQSGYKLNYKFGTVTFKPTKREAKVEHVSRVRKRPLSRIRRPPPPPPKIIKYSGPVQLPGNHFTSFSNNYDFNRTLNDARPPAYPRMNLVRPARQMDDTFMTNRTFSHSNNLNHNNGHPQNMPNLSYNKVHLDNMPSLNHNNGHSVNLPSLSHNKGHSGNMPSGLSFNKYKQFDPWA